MCRPLFVSKRSQEGAAHIAHAVHAHSRALEDAAAENGEHRVRSPRQAQPASSTHCPREPAGTASCPSPGGGEDSIEKRCLAVSGGQKENILCRERQGWRGSTHTPQAPGLCTLTPPAPRPDATLHSRHSRSWSKWVSPSTPGTEHTSRAFRNVVHLLTKLRWPPRSFCSQVQTG